MQNASRKIRAVASLVALLAVSGCEVFPEVPSVDCADDAYVVGVPGQFAVQELTVEWDVEQANFVSRREMLRFALPEDLVGAVFTLDDPGATPAYYDTFLDGRLMTSIADDPGTAQLSKGMGAWSNTVSVSVPSNAKTMPRNGRCLELDPLSLGGRLEDGATLTVSSVRRPLRQLGTTFDVQVRILDDAILTEELIALAPRIRQVFQNAGPNAPLPRLMDEALVWTSVDGTGSVVVDSEMAPGELYYELASAEMEGLERGVNIIFVSELLLESIDDDLTLLGLAGGIPAAPFDGTGASSLFISVESHLDANGNLLLDLMASTIAHELGHMLGLFHLTERDGVNFDPIADTPECSLGRYDANEDDAVGVSECLAAGADNMMFWEAVQGAPNRLSPEQIAVLRSHPLMYVESP